MISTYDQASDTLLVDATLVSSSYGFTNLYKDEDEDDPYHIEKLFSKLESQAAIVIKRIEDSSGHVTLPRRDVNTLRKFLFLLSYRNGSRSRQFSEGLFDDPTRQEVETFMQLRGLKNYRAVWMLNILNILVSEHWEVTTNQGILHSDRSLYSTQSETFRLAVYVAPTDFQFILTEDGFGLYEGTVINVPSVVDQLLSTLEDHPAPSCIPIANTLTYAVSPRLVLMLQASHMTREQSRVNQGVPRSLTRAQLYGQTLTESYFSDYPLSQVRVTYSPPLAPGDSENCIRDK